MALWISLIVSVVTVVVGFVIESTDMIFTGILLSALFSILILCSVKTGKPIRIWTFIMTVVCLIPYYYATLTKLSGFVYIAFVIPEYLATSVTLILTMVAYCGVRLDSIMFNLYLFFTSFFVVSLGEFTFYIYGFIEGTINAAKEVSNYWAAMEYAAILPTVLLLCLAAVIIMRKKNVKLLTSEYVLKGDNCA